MKNRLFCLSLFLLPLLAGCAGIPQKVANQLMEVRDAMTSMLPSDFSGPVDMSRKDGYVEITLKAGDVHKNDKGEWTWKWVDYERKTHIPWFAGAQWTSDVHFKLGAP